MSVRNFPALIKLIFISLGSIVLISAPASASDSKSSTALKRIEISVLSATAAEELNKEDLSPKLRTALLDSARPEDLIALKTLLSKYKKTKSLKFRSTGGRLIGISESGNTVLSIEVDPFTSNRFSINGTVWTIPESGSILTSLRKNVFAAKQTKNQKDTAFVQVKLFLPFALAMEGDSGSDTKAVAATYFFVSAHQGSKGEQAANYLKNRDVQSALLHGDGFPNGRTRLESWMSFWGPTKVQCTPEGAKGFALISGTEVEFLAKNDTTLIATSKGHQQSVVFIPKKIELKTRANNVRNEYSAVLSTPESAPSSNRHVRAMLAMKGVIDLCSLQVSKVASRNEGDFCTDAILLANRNRRAALTERGLRKLGVEAFGNRREEYLTEEYLNAVVPWMAKNKEQANALFDKVSSYVVIDDQTGSLEACLDKDCTKTTEDDTKYLQGYRIPPNEIRESVKEALAFKPTSSPKSKAAIEFDCPTKNHACKSVRVSDESNLSGKDLALAYKLIDAANQALKWDANDPSVSQPVSTLRALGPCCSEPACRAAVMGRGANLVPTGGSKENGVTK